MNLHRGACLDLLSAWTFGPSLFVDRRAFMLVGWFPQNEPVGSQAASANSSVFSLVLAAIRSTSGDSTAFVYP